MAGNLPNLYSPNLMGIDPQTARIIRDLTERVNYLTTELDHVRGDVPGLMTARAEKQNPQPGILTVPSGDIGGQDGFIRVSPDGVIASYTNPVDSQLPYIDVTTVGNVTTGLDVLHTYTLKAGTLARNGMFIRARYCGAFATNDNDKTVQGFFGGAAYENNGVIDIDGGQWTLEAMFIRVSPVTVRTVHTMQFFALHVNSANAVTAFGTGYFSVTRNGIGTFANLDTNDTIIEVRGEGTATNDVTQVLSVLELGEARVIKLT